MSIEVFCENNRNKVTSSSLRVRHFHPDYRHFSLWHGGQESLGSQPESSRVSRLWRGANAGYIIATFLLGWQNLRSMRYKDGQLGENHRTQKGRRSQNLTGFKVMVICFTEISLINILKNVVYRQRPRSYDSNAFAYDFTPLQVCLSIHALAPGNVLQKTSAWDEVPYYSAGVWVYSRVAGLSPDDKATADQRLLNHMCGKSAADKIQSSMVDGAVTGAVTGALEGGVGGAIFGDGIGAVPGAGLGGFVGEYLGQPKESLKGLRWLQFVLYSTSINIFLRLENSSYGPFSSCFLFDIRHDDDYDNYWYFY